MLDSYVEGKRELWFLFLGCFFLWFHVREESWWGSAGLLMSQSKALKMSPAKHLSLVGPGCDMSQFFDDDAST